MFEASLSFGGGTVVVLGTLDGVHLGHRRLIETGAAEKKRQKLPALALTFSAPPKGAPLLMTPQRKEALLLEQGMDQVFELDFDAVRDLSPEEFFRTILVGTFCAKVVVCGNDYRFGKNAAGSAASLQQLCKEAGIDAIICRTRTVAHQKVSSSRIRESLSRGDTEDAARLLGRPFCLDGEVVAGKRLGRELGFPTLNLSLREDLLLPCSGVYITECVVDGKRYPAVTGVGAQPTVGVTSQEVETYLIGFSGDLYGQYLSVEFGARLRGMKHFRSLEGLKSAIRKDAEKSLQVFREKHGLPDELDRPASR